MKAQKILALLLAALLIAGIFAGCAAKSYNGSYSNEVEMAPSDGIYESGSADVSHQVTDRKLIRRISMAAQTTDLTTLLKSIDQKVAELGGYVEDRDVYTGAGSDDDRNAELTIRIPADKLNTFTAHVDEVSNVTSTSESAEDVTLSYVATESRMKALQAEESRLLALIDKAANLSELLQLESRLTQVRTELEQVTSQLKVYDNLVDYGTVKLSINEVKKYTPAEKPGFWERISTGFVGSLQNLWTIITELTIFFACAIPYLLPPAALTIIIVLVVKLASRKKKHPKKEA